MDEQFPSNSYRHVATPAKKATAPKPAKTTSSDEKKIEPVVTNEVVRRKKPLGKRFLEIFVGGDSRGVAQYVFMDVLVPAAKDTLADMVREGVERMLFGESRGGGRRSFSRQGGFTPYNRVPTAGQPTVRQDPRREMSRQAKTHHSFDELLFKTRAEATEVLDRLDDLIARYDSASVADLYELGDMTKTYIDEKWGWTDLSTAQVIRGRHGYSIDLPKPEPLD